MKKLTLENPGFRYVEQSFKEWLDIQGNAPGTVYYLPLHIRELLHYLEKQQVSRLAAIDTHHLNGYYEKLKESPTPAGVVA